MVTTKHLIKENTSQAINFEFNQNLISKLELKPNIPIFNNLFGHDFKAKIVIPDHNKTIQQFYRAQLKHNIDFYNHALNFPPLFSHLGLCITFDKATKIHIHNMDMRLTDTAKALIKKYGAIILKNVYLDSEMRDMGHRNRFPQLNFHIDRNPKQDTHYSLYTRNPFDEEQRFPRTSSTLFIPYLVAYLQGLKEGNDKVADKDGLITSSVLYEAIAIPELLNSVILPHSWNEPEGIGEISIIDNSNLLHASWCSVCFLICSMHCIESSISRI